MKIAYLITRMDEYGGAQIHVRDLSLWLKGQGHEPVILAGWPGRVSDFVESQGIEFIEIPNLVRPIDPVKDMRAVQEIRSALEHVKPDLISCHSSKAGLLGRVAAKLAGVKSVFTAHGWAFTDGVPTAQKLLYKTIERGAGLISNHIITVSEFDRTLALKAHVARDNKITAIHNGMPVAPCPPRKPITDLPHRLLMVARFGPQKDHALLLNALAACADIPWVMEFVGGGDDFEMRKLCDALGLEDRVTFMGEREDVADIMARSDVYFLISKWEGFPRSILEAMRSGLPVIASDVAGVKESVVDGVTGYVVQPGDQEALAKTIRTALSNPQKLCEMGLNGRARFEQNFTFLTMAAKTVDLYKRVISG